MNSFRPPDNVDTRVGYDSESVASDGGDAPLDGGAGSLAIEVLNRRLHDQQFYTRSLIESSIDALMTTDTKGIIVDVNQQMVDLTGRTRDELIGAPCRNFFTDPARADAAIARVLTQDRINDFELTVRSLDGTETVMSYNAATLRDRERMVRGVFAAARDVTESKRLERALVERNLKLEQAKIARAEYVARAKVDLLTPLRAVVESSEALRTGVDGALSEAQQQRVDVICSDSKHLQSLLSDLIGMSKVETGLVDFDFQDVDVCGLLAASATAVDQSGEPKISMTVDVSDGVGLFPVDASNVQQILAVMLSNATVASTGGDVKVSARIVDLSAVGEFDGTRPHWSFPIPPSDYKEFLEIRVADHGVGLSVEDLPTVFRPLRHGESNSSWKSIGNGIGLAMVKLLVELQDGTLGVQGALGEGATFAVWLPRRALETPAAAEAPVPTVSSTAESSESEAHGPLQADGRTGDALLEHASQELITAANRDSDVDLQGLGEDVASVIEPSETSVALVVEDDEKSAKLVRLLLEAEGFRVIAAQSGEVALELARRTPINLITLDVQLPGMDGWKFLVKLHDSPELASIPVVVIAGLADMSMALNRGASAVLEKPLRRADLQHSLTLLELRPDPAHTRCILVVDDDLATIDQVYSYLEQPAYRVQSASTGAEAINNALTLKPDLVLINLMMEELAGFKIVRALQEHAATKHIPVLAMSSGQLTNEEQDTIDSDPGQPVVAMKKPDFNREALLAEIKRAFD
ncbi:response regulator [Cryobacterium glaciale]|uniref:histidine kinase n=1 Tax=Cryobacterium glaciale TaxID=1259145 RepID=A0A4R8V5B4_9MICO|nr:response regulator [Cryobacterium glaciale]TFB76282.1 response regulator [Cryobacterium glaciale]